MPDPELADDTALDKQETPASEDEAGQTLLGDDKPADELVADEKGEKETGDKPDDKELPPEEYADFDMPEGVEVDSALLEQAVPVFKELGLTQVQAQKLIDLQAQSIQGFSQAQQNQFADTITGWADSAKADKEIGGDAFDENIGIAKTAIEKFGTPELSQFLHDSGAGSHPEIVRMFVKIGKLTQEDQPGSGNPAAKDTDIVGRLYPNNKPR